MAGIEATGTGILHRNLSLGMERCVSKCLKAGIVYLCIVVAISKAALALTIASKVKPATKTPVTNPTGT